MGITSKQKEKLEAFFKSQPDGAWQCYRPYCLSSEYEAEIVRLPLANPYGKNKWETVLILKCKHCKHIRFLSYDEELRA